VEEHTMSFLYDGETGHVKLCDGFYNHCLFDSPYQFGSGSIEITDFLEYNGLIRAGTRPVRGLDGRIRDRQVFIEFLPHSTTDYTPSLGAGDFTGVFQLMGRLFEGKLREERQRLEDGTSAIPMVLEKVQNWQLMQSKAEHQAQALDQRFARLLIELARDRPELVTMMDVKRDRPLITQGQEGDCVYRVLSGQFQSYQDGVLVMHDGQPATTLPGAILGEISILQGCRPTATVVGDGVVLRLAKAEFLRQLDINPVFQESVEELVGTPRTQSAKPQSGSIVWLPDQQSEKFQTFIDALGPRTRTPFGFDLIFAEPVEPCQSTPTGNSVKAHCVAVVDQPFRRTLVEYSAQRTHCLVGLIILIVYSIHLFADGNAGLAAGCLLPCSYGLFVELPEIMVDD
jgi:hypothetical protein